MKEIVFLMKNEPGGTSSLRSIIENEFNVIDVNPCNAVFTLLKTAIPDIIIIDEEIDNSAAYELCKQIKYSEYYSIPVIFKGSPLSLEHKVKFIESGADDYFSDPLDPIDTIACLKAFCSRGQQFKNLVNKCSDLKKEGMDDAHSIKFPDIAEEELFKAIFQQSAVGIVQVSLEGDFQEINECFCKIVGYSREELLSMNFMDIAYPEKNNFEDEMISWVLAGQINSYEVEKRYVHKNGSSLWVKLFSSALRNGSGALKGAVGIVLDVSSQKKVESLLYESEALFRTMYESSATGIVRMSVYDKKIEHANVAFCDMLGYTEEELVGKSLKDISYAEDLPDNIIQQNKLVAGEIRSIQMEKRYVHKDGHHVWGLLNSNLIFDEQANPLCFVGSVLDITERKRSQYLLKTSEEKYRAYVDSSPYPIFVADFNGKYTDVNPAACSITGYSREEILKMRIVDLCAPEFWSPAIENLKKVVNGEQFTEEYMFIKKDGTRFYMLVSAVMIEESVLEICVDTTERKMSEKMLIEAKMLAEDASKSKSEFVANISHELRTPLNIVLGYSDILLSEMKGELNDDQRKYVSSVKDAGSNLLEIVNSLIYIAEIEAGEFSVHLSKLDLLSVIENMEKITESVASKKNISIEFEVESGIDKIVADKSKFILILHHLIGNSIKFTPEGGSINVRLEISGTDLHISVNDNGIGIPEEKQGQLFDPFVQIDWSHARKYGGVGIGLALVKELINMHGGNISLQSKIDEGTTIAFTIPQK